MASFAPAVSGSAGASSVPSSAEERQALLSRVRSFLDGMQTHFASDVPLSSVSSVAIAPRVKTATEKRRERADRAAQRKASGVCPPPAHDPGQQRVVDRNGSPSRQAQSKALRHENHGHTKDTEEAEKEAGEAEDDEGPEEVSFATGQAQHLVNEQVIETERARIMAMLEAKRVEEVVLGFGIRRLA